MVLKNTYFKKWYQTVNDVIVRPGKFFSEMPVNGGMTEPLIFATVVILFESLICVLILVVAYFPEQTFSWLQSPVLNSDFYFFTIILIILVMYFFFSSLISLPIYAAIYHIFLKLCGARGEFEATFRVTCYYTAVVLIPIILALPPLELFFFRYEEGIENFFLNQLSFLSILILFGAVIYSFYVLFKGFCVVHSMSMKRVVLAVFGLPLLLFILFTGSVYGLIALVESGDSYSRSNTLTEITAPYGTAPIIDGYITDEDRWDEAGQIDFSSDRRKATLAAKHDHSTLYILIRMKGTPQWDTSLEIFFEQYEDTHDHNLVSGQNDEMLNSNSISVDGQNNFSDDFFMKGVLESGMGTVRSNYTNGFFIQEWIVPLQSIDSGAIQIKQFPSTLGFAVLPWSLSNGVRWPNEAAPDDPSTWGDIVLLPREVPVEEPPTLFASAGTEPVVDGFYTQEDGWNDAEQIEYSARGIDYTLAAKHDYRYLYVLRMWKGGTGLEGLTGLYLEQDGGSHDHNLTTGKNCDWIISATPYELQHPEILQPGLKFSKDDGYIAHNKSNDVWVQEWVLPLQRDEANYLYVNQFPVTLGFAFIPPVWEGGATWPAGAWMYGPDSWGHLVLLP